MVRIYVALAPADMRKYANGLSALVMKSLDQEPLSGHLFVFFNRRRDIIRILFWDRDGYWVMSKRLEQGRYRKLGVDVDENGPSVVVTAAELAELLNGMKIPPRPKPPLH
jgi:transposase